MKAASEEAGGYICRPLSVLRDFCIDFVTLATYLSNMYVPWRLKGIVPVIGEYDMTEITIKSTRAEAVESELQAALDGQRCMVQDSIKRTRKNLGAFEEKYGFSTSQLLSSEADGSLDDDNLEVIEWIGETKILERLQPELELLREIRIRAGCWDLK